MLDDKSGGLDVYEHQNDNSFVGLDQNNEFNLGLGNSAENQFNNNDILYVSQRYSDANEPFHTPNGTDLTNVENVVIQEDDFQQANPFNTDYFEGNFEDDELA